jgi:hypothetical protein
MRVASSAEVASGEEGGEQQDTSPNDRAEKTVDETRTPLKYIHKALSSSTLHRLNSIFNNESLPLQIIIGVLFLTSALYCMHNIVIVFINYFQNNVLTVSSILSEIPDEFPCMFN